MHCSDCTVPGADARHEDEPVHGAPLHAALLRALPEAHPAARVGVPGEVPRPPQQAPGTLFDRKMHIEPEAVYKSILIL